MGKFIELIDDENQSVLINTDWIIYIEEDSRDKVIIYWDVTLSNGQGSIFNTSTKKTDYEETNFIHDCCTFVCYK